jgi:signal transduction histidine kinase
LVSKKAPDPHPSLDARVFAEQVRGLFSKGLLPYLTNVINGSIVVLVLRNTDMRGRAFAWLAALTVLTVARIGLHLTYVRRAPSRKRAPEWARRFTIGAALGGAMWGFAGAGLYTPGALGPQMLLLFVVGGMCAGAAASMPSHAPAFAAFAALSIGPTVGRLVADGDELHVAMAAMLTLFGVAMAAIARSGSKTLAESARLRFKNQALAEDLAKTHAELEMRVRERTVQLESAIEDRMHAEDTLVRTERLASIGSLAGGIAHQVNNPLSFVLANQTFVRERLGDLAKELEQDAELKGALEILREALEAITDAQTGADRVRRAVGDLKLFAKTDQEPRRPIQLAPALERAIRLARSRCHDLARVDAYFGPVPRVEATEGRLGQAFVQLIVNAAQSFPTPDPERNVVRVETKTDDQGRAVVEVKDEGVGIAPELVPRIFEPFFTTKPEGKGAGLGLSICHGIVASLGGHINVESAPGKGTTFQVVLPPVADDA